MIVSVAEYLFRFTGSYNWTLSGTLQRLALQYVHTPSVAAGIATTLSLSVLLPVCGRAAQKHDISMTTTTDSMQTATGRQIPIVCPGHTRPLAELQFCHVKEEGRTFLVSACHGECVSLVANVVPRAEGEPNIFSHSPFSCLPWLDKRPMLRDGTTGDWIGTWAGHKGAVWSTKLDPTGSLAATASGDFSVSVWDAITGGLLWNFPHKHIVKTCDFSPDSKRLATGGHEGILRIYNLTKPKDAPLEIVLPSASSADAKITISKCIWLSESVVLSAGSDGMVRFWHVADGDAGPTTPLHILETEGAEIRDMELRSIESGQRVLTVATGNKVFFFDVDGKQLLHVYGMPIHFREVSFWTGSRLSIRCAVTNRWFLNFFAGGWGLVASFGCQVHRGG